MDCSDQNTLSILKNQPKMRTYCTFKTAFKTEKYISNVNNIERRTLLSKFRLSDHRLEVETGRYHRPKKNPEERICTKCNILEDEIHCLMTCDINTEIREQLFEEIEHQHPIFRHMNTKDQFIYLMQNDDPNLCPLIQSFIVNCVKASYDLKSSLNTAPNTQPL